jgi:Ca2+-binding RTX toxin-like protein
MRGKALIVLALAALLVPLAAAPGQSLWFCFGQMPTIYASPGVPTNGTSGRDVILGTAGNDVIRGLGGGDRICGLGGSDTLEGGAGRDRIDGGDGDDLIRSGGGWHHKLLGGAGNDTIVVASGRNTVRGGAGSDYIAAADTAFTVLRGGGGNDTIQSGYRDDLDAGTGVDHCGLGLAVAGTNCETVELLCGSGGDSLPFLMANGTHAPGDFDGNGTTDTLYVWGFGSDWRAQIQTDGGYGAQIDLPTTDLAEAVGGHDVNGDGVDEAFVKVGSGAYTDIVGLYTLYEPEGWPAIGFSCGMRAVTFPGVPAEAQFAIGASLMNGSGLACQANGTLREYQQTTADGTHWAQTRYDYSYTPGFGVSSPTLETPAWSMVSLTLPADSAAIYQGSDLTCGSLSP